MTTTRPLALLALTLCAAVGCAGDAPQPEPGPAQPHDAAPGEAPASPAAPVTARAEPGGPEVRILSPRDGASLTALPIEVEVDVVHEGELRGCQLGDLRGELVSREGLGGAAAPAPAPAPTGGGASAGRGGLNEGDETFTAVVPGGAEADRTIARARVARKAIERILAEWSFNALRGERRRDVVRATLGTLRDERFLKITGSDKWKLTCTINIAEARNLVLDALNVDQTWGAQPFVLAACGDAWWSGPKLEADQVRGLRTAITVGAADWLNRWRFRQAPAASDQARLARAALELGTGPSTAKLGALSDAFQAPLVIAISGGVRFEPVTTRPHSEHYQGYLRVQGLRCDVYQRTTNTVLASFTVSSDPAKAREDEVTTSEVHQPWVSKGDSIGAEAERYARILGRVIASNVCRRLFDRYYALGRDAQAPANAVICPGCGDAVSPELSECPACASPLGPHAARKPAPAAPARFHSRFRFALPTAREGKNQLHVVATDAQGRRGEARSSFDYTPPDRGAPVVRILQPRDGAVVAEAAVELVFEVQDDRRVSQVFLGGQALTRPAGADQRTWSQRLQVALREGRNELRIEARDPAGNVGRADVTITREAPDVLPPTLTLLAPAPGRPVTQAPVIVVVEAKDDRGVAWVKVNGAAATKDAQGRWRVRISKPLDGANALAVEAADAAGNRARLDGTFTFDSTPPVVEAEATLTVTGKVDDLKATLTINGVAVKFDPKTGEYSVRVPPHPKHPDTVEVIATDEFGNTRRELRKVN
ncbi:MAG: hypothetical protein AB7N76_00890 [Planctomycetota bacterium]